MSGFRGVMKDGWHPKSRDGKKESWRNDFKGVNQVAGWMGKGKGQDEDRENHVSQPLSSLKDPASFGPPPKHIKFHGPTALPNETSPDTTGIGAPLPREQIQYQNFLQQQREEEEKMVQEAEAQKPAVPPLPFRANRTGFDASALPPPPIRRMASPADSATSVTSASSKPKPSIPPRIPPRVNSTSSSNPPTPPPVYSPSPPTEQPANGLLNQAAASRLSQAGVSVPALGINNNGNQWTKDGAGSSPSTISPPVASGTIGQAPVNELQARFSQMRTNSSSSPSPIPSPPVRGNKFNDQPSLSASNAESARSAISNFREKHSDKIESGKQTLSGLNQKYGMGQRASVAPESTPTSTTPAPPVPPHPSFSRSNSGTDIESVARRKAPPPPPPPKRAGIRSSPVSASTPSPGPPPLPLSTKPR